jgi:hypothetical protein
MAVFISVARRALSQSLFYVLLFFYFVTSSGELLHSVVGIYKPKIGHIIALALLGWIVLERRLWKVERQLFYAFALILASITLSSLLGTAPERSLGYVGVYLFNFVFYFFVPLQLMQAMELNKFFRVYWSSFVVVGLYAMLQVVFSLFGIYDPLAIQRIGFIARGQAWTYEPSYYALYMVPYVMFHNEMALFGMPQVTKVFARRLKLLSQNMLIVFSTSAGLIVSYPVFFIVSIIRWINPFQSIVRKKIKKAVFIFLISLVTAFVLFYEIACHSIFKFFYFGFEKHFSFWARWKGIVASTKIFLKHPLLGVGLGGISADQLQDQAAYDFKAETLEELELFDPTNCFTEVLASLGVVGLAAFVYLGVVFYRAFQHMIADPLVDIAVKKTATALMVSLIVMLIALQMNQGLFRPYIWIHAAIVYGFLTIRRPA